MSKQHTNNTIWNRLRRGLAALLSLALLAGLLPSTVLPAKAAEDWGWAAPYLRTLVDWGVMRGDVSGNMEPGRAITRAEFVTMMNRAYGYTKLNGHPFTDVRSRDWFYEDVDIAYNMGYFKGTSPTTAAPNSALTREQAAVLLARNMMLQPTVGETLGFSDSRALSDWSRGLVGAAAANGIINGYEDGTFRPQANITRGEVAAMLVRAIGRPVQTKGDHALGTVYGNVTVNTAGVTLRDGIISGNLYLTGGIDLGDVLMENITVLGEIIVSGAGESHSSQSSIALRNVTANSMTVDSISNQFVTIRAEGYTDIGTTTVRTNAYVDDSSLTGYGLHLIDLDGDNGTLLQLAGNVKEVLNRTPGSDLQVVQGSTGKITMDEYATGSKVLVDGDARVDELNLDVATQVTGTGDIKDLNVGSAGSTVEQLPDSVTIRPGITTNINGSTMNSAQAAESSAEPRLLAGYPAARNVAPDSATLVFSTNKAGTVYWAVTAVADGSVNEEDLINTPVYGNKILHHGTINAVSAKTEYTAAIANLTMDGSYYISAILVDGRGRRSPVKVTAFNTPDGTVPAFVGNPRQTFASTAEAQVTGMPNKSCLLYWALLPAGATAPTPAEFKANAVRGNLGYGSVDVVKNVNKSIQVNNKRLVEKTDYVAYLWLTDHDGAQSSQVYAVPITIPDETPPEVHDFYQSNNDADAIEFSFTMNEPGRLHWAIVTDEMDATNALIDWENEKDSLDAKVKVIAGVGAGAIKSGVTQVTAANTITQILMEATRGLDPKQYGTSNFVIYYVGEDAKTPVGNYSEIGRYTEGYVRDVDPPYLVRQEFNRYNENDKDHPLANTDVTLVFSENIQSGNPREKNTRFFKLYQDVKKLVDGGAPETDPALERARKALSNALYASIRLYVGENEVASDHNPDNNENANCVLDYRYAVVDRDRDTGYMIITFPHDTGRKQDANAANNLRAANLQSGTTYHFELRNVYDCASTPNPMPNTRVEDFRTAPAQVNVSAATQRPLWMALGTSGGRSPITLFTSTVNADDARPAGYVDAIPIGSRANDPSHYVKPDGAVITEDIAKLNDPSRIDVSFRASQVTMSGVDSDLCYDMLIWADTNIKFSLYSRELDPDNAWYTSNALSWDSGTPIPEAVWTYEGSGQISGASVDKSVMRFTSLFGDIKNTLPDLQQDMVNKEYVIHVDEVTDGRYGKQNRANEWNETIQFRVTFVAGTQTQLNELKVHHSEDEYNALTTGSWALSPISFPEHLEQGLRVRFMDSIAPIIEEVNLVNSDTTPEINVRVDRAGTIHCIAIPLQNVTYSKDGKPVPAPSARESIKGFLDDGNQVDSFQIMEGVYLLDGTPRPPLSLLNPLPFPDTTHSTLAGLSAPSPERLTGPATNFYEGVIKGTGTTPSANSAAKIRFEQPLNPNTIYYVCMATQGSTTASLATTSYGFWFVTDIAQRPILQLQDSGSVNVTAQVDRAAYVQARLLNQANLSDAARAVFAEKLNKQDGTNYVNWDTTAAAVGSAEFNTYSGLTVLEALRQSCGDTGDNRCSVFDRYASTALKRKIQDIVETGSSSYVPPNTILRNWGANWVDQMRSGWYSDVTGFDDVDSLDKSNKYVVVAVAYTSENSPRAFRAATGLQVVTTIAPRVTSVSANVYKTGSVMTGTVSIVFDQDLWLREGGAWLPMAHTGEASITDTDYIPLGKYLRYPAGSVIKIAGWTTFSITDTITINVDSLSVNADDFTYFQISLPGNLCNEWGYSLADLGNSTIEFNYDATAKKWVPSVPTTIQSPNYRG